MARPVLLRIASIAGALVGSVIGGTAMLGTLVGLEAVRVRSTLRSNTGADGFDASGIYGEGNPGQALRLAVLGDSLAAGVGAGSADYTVGAILAKTLVLESGKPVRLWNVAVSGSRSKDLQGQIYALRRETDRVDAALIVVGSNDVMGLGDIGSAVRELYRAVTTLRRTGCSVVVATCPDLDAVRPLVQPLRYLAHRLSRQLAVAQTMVVLRAGGRPVPLGVTLGALFRKRPNSMFSADRLHPSPLGYARAAAVLLPSVRACFGLSGRVQAAATPTSAHA
ncbi:MAG: SGNH/GDSL hydrolase family protein [Microbacteriaceae bacterium]